MGLSHKKRFEHYPKSYEKTFFRSEKRAVEGISDLEHELKKREISLNYQLSQLDRRYAEVKGDVKDLNIKLNFISKSVERAHTYSEEYSGEILTLLKEVKKAQNAILNKQKGDEFEGWCIERFNSNYFQIVNWSGDKAFHSSRSNKTLYANSNRNPDFTIVYKNESQLVSEEFFVECKYRSEIKEEIEWCKQYQLDRYRDIRMKTNKKVFIVLGVGGEASAPEKVYVFPLGAVSSTKVQLKRLKGVEYNLESSSFFYEVDKDNLKLLAGIKEESIFQN